MSNNNLNTWDLESILNGESLEDLFKKMELVQNELVELYKSFLKNKNSFTLFLEKEQELIKLSNRIENYVSNKGQENMADPKWIGWMQNLIANNIKFSEKFSDYNTRLIKNEDIIREYLKDENLKEWQREFDLIFRYKNHILSDESEALLSQLSGNNYAVADIYSTLTDNDLKFADAVDSNGNKVELKTQADVFKNLRSMDEKLRKSTWYSFYNAFYQFRNTLTKSLYYNYLRLNNLAKIRKFEDYIDSVAFDDEINKEFILNLYKNIKLMQPLYVRYYKLRNRYLKYLLNKQKIMPWDSSVELTHSTRTYTWEETKKIALDSLGTYLGEDYKKLVQCAFDENWISYLPSPNKHTGAYSIGGTKGLDKYFLLMNFDSTIQSAFTLVHELGHSMNSYFYGKSQKLYQETKIFYAEVASITNEMLLSHYLLNESNNDNNSRLLILDEIISGFFNTTSRQVVFSNFEWVANSWINENKSFTYENITNEYYKLMKEYLNIDMSYEEFNKDPYMYILLTPLRISHFYSGNFYVYKYAIGQIAAIIIADEIINNKENAKEKLFKFLSSGTSLNPIETIKLLGIDLQTNEPYIKARNILEKWIDEFALIIDKMLPKN